MLWKPDKAVACGPTQMDEDFFVVILSEAAPSLRDRVEGPLQLQEITMRPTGHSNKSAVAGGQKGSLDSSLRSSLRMTPQKNYAMPT